MMTDRSLMIYRWVSLLLAALFAVVGLIFLLLPGHLISFFNSLSSRLDMETAPETGCPFFLALAVAYMYLVTLFAWLMFRYPRNKVYPFLLAQAKFASSLLSFGLFSLYEPYLIYLANGVVDAAIGLTAGFFYLKLRSATNAECPRQTRE